MELTATSKTHLLSTSSSSLGSWDDFSVPETLTKLLSWQACAVQLVGVMNNVGQEQLLLAQMDQTIARIYDVRGVTSLASTVVSI